MGEIVTIKDLEEKYGWGNALLRNMEHDEMDVFQKGEFLFYSKSRNECHLKALEFDGSHMGVVFFGKNPLWDTHFPMLNDFLLAKPATTHEKENTIRQE